MLHTVYISGKVSGTTDAKQRFEHAETLLKTIGYLHVINPLKLDHSKNTEWHQHMITDISALLHTQCKTMYMLKDWRESPGARIEHAIAIETGMRVLYEP
jgi:hypothetical protein